MVQKPRTEPAVLSEDIKSWPSGEGPREKMLLQGAASLSDAELLAVLLRTGYKGCSVLQLARNLLTHFEE